jgi:aryl-alcohol dehydrogenase-like predicted oxidoreductase
MRYRLFGASGLRVSELFLGAMTFGEQGGVGAAPEECQRIIDTYADAGGNVIDTAINYRGGASEEILGEVLTGRRDRFVLATKYTVSRDRERELLPMAETLGMTVAAWSPLAGGILSGKFSSINPAGPGTRIDPASLTEHQRTVAASVQAVAGELGVTAAQVAIAWTRARSPAIHPIIGARRADQLLDNLRAADLELPHEAIAQLDRATELDLGFPSTFISDTSPWVFGAAEL